MTTVAAHILLINPNSSVSTSAMMQAIAQRAAADRLAIHVVTADRSPPMLTTPDTLAASVAQVVELGMAHDPQCAGIIVAAFGDPGLIELRSKVKVPVVGICEASMIAAAQGGRRFAVATSTPALADAITRRAHDFGFGQLFTGVRCTVSDPLALATDAGRLVEELTEAVRVCIEIDGAQAVIIGGGPLGQAAEQIRLRFKQPVFGPIPLAVTRIFDLLGKTGFRGKSIRWLAELD